MDKRHSFLPRAIHHSLVSLFFLNFTFSAYPSWTIEVQLIKQHVDGFLKLLFEGPILYLFISLFYYLGLGCTKSGAELKNKSIRREVAPTHLWVFLLKL